MQIVFLTPHQKPTSGGVNVIHAHASRLARRHDVTILVKQGHPRSVDSCQVAGFDDGPASADVVVLPADMADPGIVDAARITFLQGTERNLPFEESPTVLANVSDGRRVIACSRWLAEAAQAVGGGVTRVPSGLDHDRFRPPRVPLPRSIDIAMLAHQVPSKGTADGLAAIERIRIRRSHLRIVVFGGREVDAVGVRSVGALSHAQVARLFRRTKIVLSPSWQEGFGLPGLEAMACGAVLVTTDSKGPRDYAEDGVNALVVEPQRPHRLAEAVERLLNDRRLRRRLAERGVEMARSFPDWAESSRRFEEALERMLVMA